MLCAKDLKRSDNLNRHLALCHNKREEYVGYKECSNFTFSCVGEDYPHMFVAEKKGSPNQYVGYCTGCFKAISLPQYTRTMESACKHIKSHTCVPKQVRTRKVVVKTEDASGNVSLKKEMQTGGVRITEEMLDVWHKSYPKFEVLPLNDETDDYDILATLKEAAKRSHMFELYKQQQNKEAAKPADTSATSDDIYLQVMKSFLTTPVIGEWMTADIKAEQDKLTNTDDYDSDGPPPEPNYREALRKRLFHQKRLTDIAERMRKERGELLEKLDLAEGKYKRDMFESSEKLAYTARLLEERDEENRQLRAALQQYKSKLEVIQHVD